MFELMGLLAKNGRFLVWAFFEHGIDWEGSFFWLLVQQIRMHSRPHQWFWRRFISFLLLLVTFSSSIFLAFFLV
jgi:hypothetical protein